jgi:hypothetical protein
VAREEDEVAVDGEDEKGLSRFAGMSRLEERGELESNAANDLFRVIWLVRRSGAQIWVFYRLLRKWSLNDRRVA